MKWAFLAWMAAQLPLAILLGKMIKKGGGHEPQP